MIAARTLEALLGALDGVGAQSDGFHRLAWTAQERRAAAWFHQQAAATDLAVQRDEAGNLWACPPTPPPWVAVGSHLDTVAGGGRYDGALGVACAFAIAGASTTPVAVVSFADEEGARFNTPTFGSRALVGRLDVADVLARRDADGTTLASAMSGAGVDPARLGDAPRGLTRLRAFLEIHIDQSRELAEAGAPVGIVSALAARTRVAVEIEGEADHAGTTRKAERRDALAAAARLIVAAEDLAAADERFVVTATRILAEPNALSTIPARVRLWLDARAPDVAAVDAWRAALERAAATLGDERRVAIGLSTASRSAGVRFDDGVRRALHASAADEAPEVVCFAGHVAGILAERIPAAMVLVRNPTGVSHSAAEHVDLADAAIAAQVVARAVEALA
jgi:N-carbamoyl-L-amino-acid hydrolase